MIHDLAHVGILLGHVLLAIFGVLLVIGLVVSFGGILVCVAQLSWMGLEPVLFPLPKPGCRPLDAARLQALSEEDLDRFVKLASGDRWRLPGPSYRKDRYRPLYEAGLFAVVGDKWERRYAIAAGAVEAVSALRERRELELAKKPRRRLSAFA